MYFLTIHLYLSTYIYPSLSINRMLILIIHPTTPLIQIFVCQWWTLLATPITYWIFGVNVFHDASHFALSRDWRINCLGTYVGWWFSSPLEWYHQHVIGHHAYPNIPHRVRRRLEKKGRYD